MVFKQQRRAFFHRLY